MNKGLGMAAFLVGTLAIIVPLITIYVIWISLILAALAGLLGDKLYPLSTVIINLFNILLMSPLTLMALKGEELQGGSTPLMSTTVVLFIAPIAAMILGTLKGKS